MGNAVAHDATCAKNGSFTGSGNTAVHKNTCG